MQLALQLIFLGLDLGSEGGLTLLDQLLPLLFGETVEWGYFWPLAVQIGFCFFNDVVDISAQLLLLFFKFICHLLFELFGF